MRKPALFWYLFAGYLVLTVSILFGVTWYASAVQWDIYVDEKENALREWAGTLQRVVEPQVQEKNIEGLKSYCRNFALYSSSRLTILSATGKVWADTHENPALMENLRHRPEIVEALSGAGGFSIRRSRTLPNAVLYAAVPIVGTSGEVEGVLRISGPIITLGNSLRAARVRIIWMGLVIVGLGAFGGWLFSKKLSAPLEDLKNGAIQFSRGNLNRHLYIRGAAEITDLTDALNTMARELRVKLETVQQQQNELNTLFGSMSEGMLAVDSDCNVLAVNNAARRILGMETAPVKGTPLLESVRIHKLYEFLSKVLADGLNQEAELSLVTAAGTRQLKVTGSVLLYSGSGKRGAMAVISDITRIKKLEDVRREFVGNVSHELKTPIAAIKGAAETLDSSAKVDSDSAKFVRMIINNADRLARIIDDLLALARLESGESSLPFGEASTALAEIVRTSLSPYQTAARKKNIRLDCALDEKIQVRGNPHLLEQAIGNLVENAVGYSEEGTAIRIVVRRQNKRVSVSITDSGPGIAERHLPHIFERFYRVDKARSRRLGGTGLGLSIVKHIAQVHGGSVKVESRVGVGSTFSIVLPAG